jgi:CRP-like cAMP-binding protein
VWPQCTLLLVHRKAFRDLMRTVPDIVQRLRTHMELRARQTKLQVAIAVAQRGTAEDRLDAQNLDAYEANARRVDRLVKAASALGQPSR